jgi:hypothetical protein
MKREFFRFVRLELYLVLRRFGVLQLLIDYFFWR